MLGRYCARIGTARDALGGGNKMEDKFDLKKETDHWTSDLLACIAEGNFRDGVSRMIQYFLDREDRKAEARVEGPITDERLTLSITEAAETLRISRNLAYTLAREGKLPVIRFGRRLIVPRKGLNGLLS
jgi:excisionase family DNA binding protein